MKKLLLAIILAGHTMACLAVPMINTQLNNTQIPSNISINGTITASAFVGSGAGLTGLPALTTANAYSLFVTLTNNNYVTNNYTGNTTINGTFYASNYDPKVVTTGMTVATANYALTANAVNTPLFTTDNAYSLFVTLTNNTYVTNNYNSGVSVNGDISANSVFAPNIITTTLTMNGNIRLNNNWLSGDGGSEGVFVSSNGNVGIDTTVPSVKLQIGALTRPGASSNTANYLGIWGDAVGQNTDVGGIKFYNADGEAAFGYQLAEISAARNGDNFGGSLAFKTAVNGSGPLNRMFIDSNGNVGIGTTSPLTALDVNGVTTVRNNIVSSTSNFAYTIGVDPNAIGGAYVQLYGSTYAAPNIVIFGTSNNERARINAVGNVGIGTTAPSQKLEVAGAVSASAYYLQTASTGTGTSLIWDANGQILPLTSSKRFKKNISPLKIDSSRLYDLNIVEYDYLNDSHSAGFIAEEVNEVLPILVNLDSEGQPYSLRQDQFIPLLISELKALRDRVEVLESQVKKGEK